MFARVQGRDKKGQLLDLTFVTKTDFNLYVKKHWFLNGVCLFCEKCAFQCTQLDRYVDVHLRSLLDIKFECESGHVHDRYRIAANCKASNLNDSLNDTLDSTRKRKSLPNNESSSGITNNDHESNNSNNYNNSSEPTPQTRSKRKRKSVSNSSAISSDLVTQLFNKPIDYRQAINSLLEPNPSLRSPVQSPIDRSTEAQRQANQSTPTTNRTSHRSPEKTNQNSNHSSPSNDNTQNSHSPMQLQNSTQNNQVTDANLSTIVSQLNASLTMPTNVNSSNNLHNSNSSNNSQNSQNSNNSNNFNNTPIFSMNHTNNMTNATAQNSAPNAVRNTPSVWPSAETPPSTSSAPISVPTISSSINPNVLNCLPALIQSMLPGLIPGVVAGLLAGPSANMNNNQARPADNAIASTSNQATPSTSSTNTPVGASILAKHPPVPNPFCTSPFIRLCQLPPPFPSELNFMTEPEFAMFMIKNWFHRGQCRFCANCNYTATTIRQFIDFHLSHLIRVYVRCSEGHYHSSFWKVLRCEYFNAKPADEPCECVSRLNHSFDDPPNQDRDDQTPRTVTIVPVSRT